MHKNVHRPCQLAGRPNGRPTEGNPLLGRPGGRPAKEPLLSGSGRGRPGGRPAGSTVINLTVGWSIGRSFLTFLPANGHNFYGAINTPFEVCFQQEFLEQKFPTSLVFKHQVFKRVLGSKYLSSFILKCWKIQRNREYLGIGFDLYLNIYLVIFSSVFLCCFHFQTLYFLT